MPHSYLHTCTISHIYAHVQAERMLKVSATEMMAIWRAEEDRHVANNKSVAVAVVAVGAR